MPSNYKILVNGVLTDTDEYFSLRENFPFINDPSILSGRLYAWGSNNFGQLGLNDLISRSSPVQVGTGTDWKSVVSNDLDGAFSNVVVFRAAIKTNGTLWMWGENTTGQHGQNDTVRRSSPVQVGTDSNWSACSLGDEFTIAIKNNGILWTWGENNFGQLGQNDTINRSSPVQLGSDIDWKEISCGAFTSAAIKTDGTLWSWGSNTSGQLGQNDTISRSSPVQVGTDNDWEKISRSVGSIMAIKTNGTLWAWGRNIGGILGLNDTIDRSSPVQVGTDTDWKSVVMGARIGSISNSENATCAIKTNGTLWAWGFNTRGELGQNDIINRSSPVQVGTLSNWENVECYASIITAVKTDGTLWTWGNNASGQLGLNDTVSRSSPVQLGALTNWDYDIATGIGILI